MENCIHCQAQINNEEYNFCPECEGQIRCLKADCRKLLKPGKTICLVCGTQVKIDSSKKVFNTLNIEESYSENTASRKINVEATDNAIDKIAVAVANLTSPFGNTQRKFPNVPVLTTGQK